MLEINSACQLRKGLETSRRLFNTKTATHIAFLGGSITEMNGYTAFTEEFFRGNFPCCEFQFINAGISSTCSNTGAFRIQQDILDKSRIDLLFVEFAVNDNQDGHLLPEESIRAMEGIVRQALRNNPAMDIVFLYTTNESHLADYQTGKIPREIAAHERVAEHYRLPSLNFAQEIARRISAGEFDWKKFGGVHPAPFGNQIYADAIARAFASPAPQAEPITRQENLPLLDDNSLIHGCLVPPAHANFSNAWQLNIPVWEKLPGEKRARFCQCPVLHANTPGAEFSLDFTGNAIGLFLTAGPDAGLLEFNVDESGWMECDLFHHYSRNLHYPCTRMLAQTLKPGKHAIRIRISVNKNPASSGHAARIMAFALNQP
ncbi:MAG: SGNH/GDSL hydrolase family protein [Lentisphaeria bacterium]|nr:SGNH/GDSL hydrolase family protein [Lentisphaeria bacterium]